MLQERQAGVELGGAVAEGQGATLCPGAAARCRCHTVLFQQDCNHLAGRLEKAGQSQRVDLRWPHSISQVSALAPTRHRRALSRVLGPRVPGGDRLRLNVALHVVFVTLNIRLKTEGLQSALTSASRPRLSADSTEAKRLTLLMRSASFCQSTDHGINISHAKTVCLKRLLHIGPLFKSVFKKSHQTI